MVNRVFYTLRRMNRRSALRLGSFALWALAGVPRLVFPSEPASVIILGSGTPIPDPLSSGPAVAIVAGGQAYLFDAGAGVVRRAEEAAERYRIPGLAANNLTRLFLTHLHSDHTLGYADVILTSWVEGRREALEVFGPKGTAAMTEHLKLAFSEDIDIRTHGLEHEDAAGLRVNVHEISAGPVYRDARISVRAIAVRHGSWPQAFGSAIEVGGRTIVLSGDTAPCPAIEEACQGCDVLVHEVYSAARFARLAPSLQEYHAAFHTSTSELAAIAMRSKPKLLVLYHQIYFGPRQGVDLVQEIRQGYSGKVVSSRDLDSF
jgi:ribonuclease BN (tRNA processing enzyme)